MNATQDRAFSQLLAAWRRREEARSADIRQLADAHFALDGAREQMQHSMLAPR